MVGEEPDEPPGLPPPYHRGRLHGLPVPLGVGDTLRGTLRVLRRQGVPLLLYAVVTHLPLVLLLPVGSFLSWTWFLGVFLGGLGVLQGTMGNVGFPGGVAAFLLAGALLRCLVAPVVVADRRGLARAGRRGLRGALRLLAVLGVEVLLQALIAITLALVLGLAGVTVLALPAPLGAFLAFLAVLGGLAAPVFVAVLYFVAPTAAVLEGLGPFRALSRSSGLVQGAAGSVALLVLFTRLARGVLALLLLAYVEGSVSRTSFLGLAGAAILVLEPLFGAVVETVTWDELRARKEGPSIEGIADVFA